MVGCIVILTLLFSFNWSGEGGIFAGADWFGSFIYATTIVMPIVIITDKSLSRIEKMRIGVIYIIAFFVVFFGANCDANASNSARVTYSGVGVCAGAGLVRSV